MDTVDQSDASGLDVWKMTSMDMAGARGEVRAEHECKEGYTNQ